MENTLTMSRMTGALVITFGTFDLLHVGHIRILRRAANLGSTLIVGISSDKLNIKKKGRNPVYSQDQRMEMISSLSFVDAVFIEEDLEKKPEYLLKFKADKLVMGDDWEGKFDYCKETLGLEDLEIVYLPRTPSISTTQTIESVKLFK